MALPVILWSNILRNSGATVTASSTETGNFAVGNLSDFFSWSVWKSGTLTTGITIDIDVGSDTGSADTIGLVNHNITSEVGTIELRADTAAGPNPPTTVRQAAYTPTYGDVDLKTFTLASNLRRWRLVLAKGGNFANKPFIGELFLGMRMTLPEYLSPDIDPFLKSTEAAGEFTEGGQYAGATVRGRTHPFTLAISDVGAARSFHTSDLTAFVDTHLDLLRPFILQVDSDDTDFKRPVYVVREGGGRADRLAVGSSWTRLGFRCPVVEAYMEAA